MTEALAFCTGIGKVETPEKEQRLNCLQNLGSYLKDGTANLA
jgi:hypothetical protein